MKTGNIYILFTKVAQPADQRAHWSADLGLALRLEHAELAWHNANFRKMGLTIAQMWNGSDADAKLVDLSGDVPTPQGGGFPTQEQVLELRARVRRSIRPW